MGKNSYGRMQADVIGFDIGEAWVDLNTIFSLAGFGKGIWDGFVSISVFIFFLDGKVELGISSG
jgi:hypothetical protein